MALPGRNPYYSAMFRGRRIDSYILTELLLPTLVALALYVFTLLMNEFFLIAQQAISKNLPWDVILRLFAFNIPRILVLSIPMSVLLGTLIAVGRLSSDHEWIALQSAGAGPWVLLRPVLIHGTMASLLAFVVYGYLLPAATFASRELKTRVLASTNLAAELRPRVFYDDVPGTVFFVDEIRRQPSGSLSGVFLYQAPQNGATSEQLILARSGDLYPAPDRSGALEVDLRDGVLHSFKPGAPQEYVESRFKRYVLRVELPAYLRREPDGQRTPQDTETLALFGDLRAARNDPDASIRPYRVKNVLLELHQRFALPAAALLLAVLAAPLGITRARSGKGAGFAWSLLVIFIYWTAFTVGRGQAVRGRIPPVIGIWGANFLLLAWIGVQAIRRPFRERDSGPSFLLSAGSRLLDGLRWISRRLSRSGSKAAEDATGGSIRAPLGLVDRYIASQYLRILLMALLSAYLVYAIVEMKSLLDGVVEHHRPVSLVAAYFKYFAPGMLQYALPVSCLVAGVVAFTLLARRGELTALKAGGMGIRRAIIPVVAVTLLLCGFQFFVQDRVAPITNRKALEIRDQIFARAPRSYGFSSTGRWAFGSGDRLYQYRLYDPQNHTFQGLSVFTLDRESPRILEHRYLASAQWDGTLWSSTQGWVRDFRADNVDAAFRRTAGEDRIELDPPETFAQRERSLSGDSGVSEQMTLKEVNEQIESLTASGYDATRLRVEFFAKIARPFTPLVMLLLGLPFAFRAGRSGSMYAVGISLLLVIVYWATSAMFNALGLETVIPAPLAAFAPNVLYGVLGCYLLLLVRT